MKQKNLLFLCTGNSCRSQMAEGWAKALAAEIAPDMSIQAQSAGLEAHGLNPLAVETMLQHGVDISGHTSDIVTDVMIKKSTTVITVCSHADDHCPIISEDIQRIHIPFTDPAKATGSEEEIAHCFDSVCKEIKKEVEILLNKIARNEL